MKKRYVFDLDGTLLTGSFDFEKDYFESVYGDDSIDLVNNMGMYLDEYEKTFPKYRRDDLSSFLSLKSGILVTPKIIDGWIEVMSDVPDTMEDDIIYVLEELKKKDCSLAVLTNWFGETQIPRLKRAGMIEYFDNIYTGDLTLKPHKQSYEIARSDYKKNECIFIGDNIDKDYIGPRACGMESVLYDKNERFHNSLVKVKKMDEMLKKY